MEWGFWGLQQGFFAFAGVNESVTSMADCPDAERFWH